MKRIGLIIVILGIAVLGAAAMFGVKKEPPKKERVDIDPLVTVMTLETMAVDFEIRSQGTVLPRTETVLSAEVTGTIVDISPQFVAGGVFRKSETLLRIDPTNYEVELDQAEAIVKQRQIEYDGASKLRSQGYRAESEYASAAAALASARAELVRARRNLERTFVRLPYEGMVRSKETDLGQFVSTGTRVGVAFATNYAEVRLPLTDLDLAFLELPAPTDIAAAGNVAGPLVTLTAIQKGVAEQWLARITRTEGVVDEKSRVTYAVARIDDPYGLRSDRSALPIGTFVGARIQGSSAQDIIRVPRSAVRGSRQLLFLNDDNRIEIRDVDIVRSDSEFSYLRAAAIAGKRIVTSALEAPIEGMSVRIEAQTATSDNGNVRDAQVAQ